MIVGPLLSGFGNEVSVKPPPIHHSTSRTGLRLPSSPNFMRLRGDWDRSSCKLVDLSLERAYPVNLTQTLIIINFARWNMVHVLSNWLAVRSLLKSGLTGFVILARRLGSSLRSARCRSAISAVQSPSRECRGCLSIASTPAQVTGYITASAVERWSCCGAAQSAPKRETLNEHEHSPGSWTRRRHDGRCNDQTI